MLPDIASNPIIDRLPAHLHQYIKPQNYHLYSSIDQAVWRYVMRNNVSFLSQVAHKSYLIGLKNTGISVDTIPNMYGMNRILKDIGWAAVAVDGFIPPAAFMEFQAYNVLVIASDIRTLKHIEYTPAPDIIHEAAGHAPIIANPEYAEYLRRLGEIGAKAISSKKDWTLYEAVRLLSQLKEQKIVDKNAVAKAEQHVQELQATFGKPSEMARIRNLQWWSVEYGLIGTLEEPRIYGAGLLSSIGESKWCLTDEVKKLPYSIKAADLNFDITKPQPQLFVTPDFAHLSLVLEQFANQMSLRKGSVDGVKHLIESENLGTIELSTGLEISGVFSRVLKRPNGNVAYVQTTGPTALAHRGKELIGHGTGTHQYGYGSALGTLKGINLAIEDMSPRDLEAYDIYEGKRVKLEFDGGITVEGEVITGTRNLQGKILLITFKDCTVKHKREYLFTPDQGLYHMAVGKEVVSAYAGPADNHSFDMVTHELSSVPEVDNKSKSQITLENLYAIVRALRDNKVSEDQLQKLVDKAATQANRAWLLFIELYELALSSKHFELAVVIGEKLAGLQKTKPELAYWIEQGMLLAEQPRSVMV